MIVELIKLPFLFDRALHWFFEPSAKYADWKGALQHRFVLRRFRFEWDRWRYQPDCCGKTRASWQERNAVQE
jgi:hypothetical protein